MRSEVPYPSVTPNNLPMLRAQPRLLVCSPVRQINYIGCDIFLILASSATGIFRH